MATELARSYVQIVPTATGMTGMLTTLFGGEASKAGSEIGNSIVGMIKSVIIGAGLGAMIKESLSAGADLQQSIGGIETLFGTGGQSIEEYAAKVGKSVDEIAGEYARLKDAEETMLGYADEAYKTAGLSANEYMETVTSFAASLKQSTGDNMEELTSAANQAVIDMADNANKMGTSMESIQNAYQGFAKQNYTMLDNLKLGYGGTKQEMQRLLADASKLSGIEYNMDSLADVYSAIHVVQTELGITGTTAKEAASTFSGSMASMKSAAQNVLAKLALGENIKPALNSLIDSVMTFAFDNFMPMLGNILSGVPDIVEQLASGIIGGLNKLKYGAGDFADIALNIVSSLIKSLVTMTPYIIESGIKLIVALGKSFIEYDWIGLATNLITSLKDGLDLAAGEILGADENLIGAVLQLITDGLPFLMEKGMDIVNSIFEGFNLALPFVTEAISNVLNVMMDFLSTNLPVVLQKGIEIVTSIVNGIMVAIPEVINAVKTILDSLLNFVTEKLPDLLNLGIELIVNVANGILNGLPKVITAIGDVLQSLLNFIVDNLPLLYEKGSELIRKLVEGIKNAIPDIVSSIGLVIANLLATIILHWPDILESGYKLLGELIAGIISCVPVLITSILNLISDIIEKFQDTDWLEVGKNILIGIKNGIVSAISTVVEAAKEAAGAIFDAVKEFFSIGSPSKLMRDEIGHWIPAGIAVGIEGNMESVTDAMEELEAETMDAFTVDTIVGNNSFTNDQYSNSDVYLANKLEELANSMVDAIASLRITATISEDEVFNKMQQRAVEYREQTHKYAYM